jgi:hypothetical protein
VFAHVLGIRPWEWALMSLAEVMDCVDWVDAFNNARRSPAAGSKPGEIREEFSI